MVKHLKSRKSASSSKNVVVFFQKFQYYNKRQILTASLIILKSLIVIGPMVDRTSTRVGLLETQPSMALKADKVTS